MRHRIRIQPYLSPEVHRKLRAYASNQRLGGNGQQRLGERRERAFLAAGRAEPRDCGWEVDVAFHAVTITRAPSGLCLGGRGRLARIRALADLSERPDKMPEVERLRENIVHLELLANDVAGKTDRADDDNRDAA